MYLRRDRALTAVSIMLDVAFHAGRSGVVSGADIAKRGNMLRRGIEPVLQALSREKLLDSVRGPKGGVSAGSASSDDYSARDSSGCDRGAGCRSRGGESFGGEGSGAFFGLR
ncbi:hypothetical protein GFGA_1c0533 [Gluconobacter frateurii NBRC 103465]|nr:hypothetical protein GFGA_1c0533 [Gluconobacter frateurii NBRC 103465]